MKDGILILDKPEGITSSRAVLKVKKVLKLNKVGHTGTLDPFATGILVLCINKSTKKANYFTNLDKTYFGTMVLGISTDTQDLTGRVVKINSIKENELTLGKIHSSFEKFQGNLLQKPPMFSAVKSNGSPLYRLARKGIKVEVEPRKICIHELSILNIRWGIYTTVSFKVKCSKGTYIRTLCNDIGEELGCGAYLSHLRRVEVGEITISESVSLEKLLTLPSEKQKDYILPIDIN